MSCVHVYLIQSLQSRNKILQNEILQLSAFDDSREVKEKMVEIEKAETGGIPYLKKSVVNDQGVKKVKIIEEPLLVEKEFEGKKSMKVEAVCSTQVLDPAKVKWTMNATTQNYMIEKYGKNTKSWIGKEIEVAIKQAGSASPGVYPKDCSLEKVIA